MLSRCLVRVSTVERSLSRYIQTTPSPETTNGVPDKEVPEKQRIHLDPRNLVQKVGTVLRSHGWGQAYYVFSVLGVVASAAYFIVKVLEEKIRASEEKVDFKIQLLDNKIQHLSDTTKEGFAHLGALLQSNQSVIEGKVNDRVKVGLLEHKLEEEKAWMEIKNELNLINAKLSARDKE